MIVQLSSGQGPVECEFAVTKLYEVLKKEFADIEIISKVESKQQKKCYSSITFFTESHLSDLEGSIQWICKSPFRPNHKRKNWFIDVSIIPEMEHLSESKDVKFDRFHCGGKGGQNVNKVETGVRLTHVQSGITVTATTERSQILNRKEALKKLDVIIQEREKQAKQKQTNTAWSEQNQLVRGNPTRIYEGMNFKRKS